MRESPSGFSGHVGIINAVNEFRVEVEQREAETAAGTQSQRTPAAFNQISRCDLPSITGSLDSLREGNEVMRLMGGFSSPVACLSPLSASLVSVVIY